MARVSARNTRGVKVRGTGHGRTPIGSATRAGGGFKKKKARRQPGPGLSPTARHERALAKRRAKRKAEAAARAEEARQKKRAAWRRWRANAKARGLVSSATLGSPTHRRWLADRPYSCGVPGCKFHGKTKDARSAHIAAKHSDLG